MTIGHPSGMINCEETCLAASTMAGVPSGWSPGRSEVRQPTRWHRYGTAALSLQGRTGTLLRQPAGLAGCFSDGPRVGYGLSPPLQNTWRQVTTDRRRTHGVD